MVASTPLVFIIVVIEGIAVYGVLKGFEVISRAVQFVLPIFLLAITIGIILALPDVKFVRLLPVFKDGVVPILQASITPSAWFGEVALLLVLMPRLNKPQEAMKKVTLAIIAIAVFLAVDTVVTLGMLGAGFTSKLMFPFWYVFRNIEYHNFIQRIESLIVFAWITGIVIKITLFSFVTAVCVKHTFSVKKDKYAIFPLALLQLPGAYFIFSNSLQLIHFLNNQFAKISLVFELVIPAVLLGIAAIRNLDKRES